MSVLSVMNRIKFGFLIIICSLCFQGIQGKILEVKNVDELTNDISARTDSRIDNNGNSCAIVLINTPYTDDFMFGDMVVGNISKRAGEITLHVSPSYNFIDFTRKNEDYKIDFSEFDLQIEEKKVYKVVLEDPQKKNTGDNTKAIIRGNYDGILVLIDGIPVGQTPMRLESINPGKHTISVPNIIGITTKDTIVDFSKDNLNLINLNFYKEKPVVSNAETYQPSDGEPVVIFGKKPFEKDDKVGLINYLGEIIVPCQYDYVDLFDDLAGNYPVLKKINGEKKWGLYNPVKGEVLPCMYRYVQDVEYIYILRDGSGYRITDNNFNIIQPYLYNQANYYNYDYIETERRDENNRIIKSILDKSGNLIYETSPGEDINNVSLEFNRFKTSKNEISYLHTIKNGKITSRPIPSEYRYSLNPKKGPQDLICIEGEGYKCGYFDMDFNIVIPPIYKDYSGYNPFKGDLAILYQDKVAIIFNKKGERLLEVDGEKEPFERIFLDNIKDNYYLIDIVKDFEKDNYNSGIFKLTAEGLLPIVSFDKNYEIKKFFKNGQFYFSCCNEKEDVIIDETGNIIFRFPKKYFTGALEPYEYENEIIFVAESITGENHILDSDYNIIFTVSDDYWIRPVENDLGFTGYLRIEESYNNESPTGSYGFVNTKGEILVNFPYGDYFENYQYEDKQEEDNEYEDEIYDTKALISNWARDRIVTEGLAMVWVGNKYGFINQDGEFVVPLIYTDITPFENGVAFAKQEDGKWIKIFAKDLKK